MSPPATKVSVAHKGDSMAYHVIQLELSSHLSRQDAIYPFPLVP